MGTPDIISRALKGKTLYHPSNPDTRYQFEGFAENRSDIVLKTLGVPEKHSVTDYSLRYFSELEVLGPKRPGADDFGEQIDFSRVGGCFLEGEVLEPTPQTDKLDDRAFGPDPVILDPEDVFKPDDKL